jgi:hypothetical protein
MVRVKEEGTKGGRESKAFQKFKTILSEVDEAGQEEGRLLTSIESELI